VALAVVGCAAPAAPTAPGAAAAGTAASTGGQHLPATPGHSPVTLAESGSTLLAPLFSAWAQAYRSAFPNVTISTAPTGSGKGIAAASAGTAAIGASDAYLTAGNLVQNPDLLNIPLAISAQQVNYNLPSLKPGVHVRLNGAVLAQMYSGQITTWNNPAIARLNKGISLPPVKVVPLHREESSGDTFLFSSYLSTGDPAWNSAIGYGTTVAWPKVPGALAETGNSGMVTGCAATPGCVAYIGISYLSQALNDRLGEAELQNGSGQFELPTAASMLAAVASFVPATPANETISMVDGPAAGGYPTVNYEYAVVSTAQPSAARARALQAFLHWAITKGSAASFLGPVRFVPLPSPVVTLANAQIARIR
jgi:phosphate transport system substrate-binding protein